MSRLHRLRWLSIIIVAVILTLASPALLVLVGEVFETDWIRAANVGQSYGFASATLSGLALTAVAYTVFLQQGDSRAARLEAHRPVHMELSRMALEDESLMNCLALPDAGMGFHEQKQHVYINLLISWWMTNVLVSKTMNKTELHEEALYLFSTTAGRHYWKTVRRFRMNVHTSKQEQAFYQQVDKAYIEAQAAGPPRSDAVSDDKLSYQEIFKPVISFSIGAGAALLVTSMLKHRK